MFDYHLIFMLDYTRPYQCEGQSKDVLLEDYTGLLYCVLMFITLIHCVTMSEIGKDNPIL